MHCQPRGPGEWSQQLSPVAGGNCRKHDCKGLQWQKGQAVYFTAVTERTFMVRDGSGFPLHRGLILEQALPSLLVSSSVGFSKTGQQSPSHRKPKLSEWLWRIHLSRSFRKVYRTHLQDDTIASPQILFLIIQILKHKKGTTKIFSGLQPTGTASNHKLNAGYPILQRLTQTSAFIGNCSNMAGQTDGPSSQITFFFCLPITASQRGGSEVCGGSAGCCGKSRQMGAGLLLSNTYSPNNLWRWVGISRDDWPHPSRVGRRSLCRPPSLLNFEGTRMTRLDETANF